MYVITNENMHNNGLWEIGIKRSGFAYASPELAVLVQHAYEKFEHFRIFEASGKGNNLLRFDDEFTLLRETYAPEFTPNQRIWFGIQCALAVCDDPMFVSWANAWIDGTDRSSKTALIVSRKLWDENINVPAADAAVYAAHIAVDVSGDAHAAHAVGRAIAYSRAAYYAAQANPSINLADIAVAALHFDLREFQEIDF
jgi:hypothetical protein